MEDEDDGMFEELAGAEVPIEKLDLALMLSDVMCPAMAVELLLMPLKLADGAMLVEMPVEMTVVSDGAAEALWGLIVALLSEEEMELEFKGSESVTVGVAETWKRLSVMVVAFPMMVLV